MITPIKVTLGLALLSVHLSATAQFAARYATVDGQLGEDGFGRISADAMYDLITDIDGDNKADSVSLLNATTNQFGAGDCNYLLISRSSALSDGLVVATDFTDHITIGNGQQQNTVGRCDAIEYYAQLGDVNADGISDIATLSNTDNGWKVAIIFLPSIAGHIDLHAINGENGFSINQLPLYSTTVTLQAMGDLDGNGYADIQVGAKVIAGAPSYSSSSVDYDNPVSVDILIDKRAGGGSMRPAGDINGDGFDDVLIGRLNSSSDFVMTYGAADLREVIELNNNTQASIRFLGDCGNRFNCNITPIGDFDADGFDELAFSAFGGECGYASIAGILYGGASGITAHRSFNDFALNERTWFSDNVGGGCLEGGIVGPIGDINGDGRADLVSSFAKGHAVVLGVTEARPSFILMDEMDGTNGFVIAPELTARDEQTPYRTVQVNNQGIDANGDGLDDVVLAPYPARTTEDISSADRFVLSGARTNETLPQLDYLVVEASPSQWMMRWAPPQSSQSATDVDVTAYTIYLDDEPLASVAGNVQSYELQRDSSAVVRVNASDASGNTIATRVRQVSNHDFNKQLEITIHGDKLVELVFNRNGVYTFRTMHYQIWRDGTLLAVTGDNVSTYWDDGLEPGTTYTNYLTPYYSLFNDVSSRQALLSHPALQVQSNSVTVTTPGLASGDNTVDDSVEGNNTGAFTLSGTTISWSGGDWFEVQSATDYQAICQGGLNCTVEPGVYNVINHSTGERFESVLIPASTNPTAPDGGDDPAAFELRGSTIVFNPQGNNDWFQVQDATSYATLCEGNVDCELPAGTYVVINHSTGDRFEGVVVSSSSSGLTVEDGLISWPDDGWYQVQNAQSYATVCEGSTSCSVSAGTYIVINHSTQQRFEDIIVSGGF